MEIIVPNPPQRTVVRIKRDDQYGLFYLVSLQCSVNVITTINDDDDLIK